MRFTWLILLCLFSPAGITAQTIIRPTPPLDSARAALRDALLVLGDSLNTIDGAAARLQRDFREASAASLLSRARVMRDACARSVRTVGPTRRVLLAARLPEVPQAKRRGELVAALDQLKGVLSHCESEFAVMSGTGQGEMVRGYANDRATRILGARRKYEQSLRNFFDVMGIRVMPVTPIPQSATG